MKNKGLFDHITHITQKQTVGYWDSLNETEKKQWSNYMIHRFLSMKMEYVDVVNEIQRYNLKPKDLYKLYINVLPKKKEWLKYVKGKKDMKHPKWLLEIVAKYYESSLVEAHEYLEENRILIKNLLEDFWLDDFDLYKKSFKFMKGPSYLL